MEAGASLGMLGEGAGGGKRVALSVYAWHDIAVPQPVVHTRVVLCNTWPGVIVCDRAIHHTPVWKRDDFGLIFHTAEGRAWQSVMIRAR